MITCKLCLSIVSEDDSGAVWTTPHAAAFNRMDQHIANYHAAQQQEFMLQAAAIVRWLSNRAFQLSPRFQERQDDMTERMIKLAASMKAEREEATKTVLQAGGL